VRVTFESDLDERRYLVYRDTATSYYLFDPVLGVRLAEKKVDVSAFLRKLLGVEPGTDVKSLFRSAIGVPQGTFTAEFLLPSAARRVAFDRLLKVEEYRDGAERLRDTVNLLRERITEVREQIATAEGQLKRYDDHRVELGQAKERAVLLNFKLLATTNQIEVKSKVVTELDVAATTLNEAQSRLSRLEIERDAVLRRVSDLTSERDAASAARKRQRIVEADYRSYLEAVERLNVLDKQRVERDALRAQRNRLELDIAGAASEHRNATEAVESAKKARETIVELAGPINDQELIETERERLREMRSQAVGERARLTSLEIELEKLRESLIQTRSKAKEAEKCQGAIEKAEQLEQDKGRLETELSQAEQAATTFAHLTRQRVSELKELERLERDASTRQAEILKLQKTSSLALELPTLHAREHEVATQLAGLKAEIARDEKFHAEVKNGLCPILSQKCLNIGEGQSLEDYFTGTFATNSTQLKDLENERKALLKKVDGAREAEKQLARVESSQKQLEIDRAQIERRKAELATIDDELASVSAGDTATLHGLRARLLAINGDLKSAREASLKFAELQPLLQRLLEIEEEGKNKREEHTAVSKAASVIGTLESEIAQLDQSLKILNDPRGRAANLKSQAESLAECQVRLQSAANTLTKLRHEAASLDDLLSGFEPLDRELELMTNLRDRTASAHREYLVSEALAKTLSARQSDLENAQTDYAKKAKDASAALEEFQRARGAYSQELHTSSRLALAAAREEAAALTAQLDVAHLRETELAAELVRLDEVRSLMHGQLRSKEKLERVREATEFIRETLKTAGPIVTESYLYNVSVEANQLFREISGEAGRTIRWSRDYEIVLEEEGYERSFANLSGGEQMAAALSIRLALLKQLSDIRIAFFDEPTTNMDAERRERLAQQIGQIEHFDQLFVISHDDTFEENVDHILHIKRDVDQNNAVGAA